MRLNGVELECGTVADLVELRAANGNKPLVWVGDEKLTYASAHERSNRIANSLASRQIGKGDVVSTYMYNHPDAVCIWFACAKLGAIWAPANVAFLNEDLHYALTDSTAKVVIIAEDLLDNYLRVRHTLTDVELEFLWGDPAVAEKHGMVSFEELLRGEDRRPDANVLPTDPMSIMYTGGSTGMPKGVLVPHLYYFASALRYRDAAKPSADDTHFAMGHLFHVGGQLLGVIGPMYSNMTTVLTRWFSASKYWDRVRQHDATIIDPIGPIIAAIMSTRPRLDDRNHRVRIGVGVATGQIRRELRDEFERRFGVTLLEVYAQTETGVILTSETLEDRRGSNGKPRGWVDVRIVDDDDFSLPPGQVGQITLRPVEPYCFMLEYWRKPVQTVKAWRNLWFHTGDVGYLDENGYLYFTGRQAHWIRRRGENVSSFEVEKILGAHPAVAEVAVVGVPGELGDEDIKAYVQLKLGFGEGDPMELIRFCEDRIAYFKVPRYFEFITEFPRSSAKQEIERHTLRNRGVGNAWDRERDGVPSVRPGER